MRRVDLSKWPMPYGYGIKEATLEYDDRFILKFSLLTPRGLRTAEMPIYTEQVLNCDDAQFGRDVMDQIVSDLNREDALPWQL